MLTKRESPTAGALARFRRAVEAEALARGPIGVAERKLIERCVRLFTSIRRRQAKIASGDGQPELIIRELLCVARGFGRLAALLKRLERGAVHE